MHTILFVHARVEVLFDKIQEKEPTQDFPPERNDLNFDGYICSLKKLLFAFVELAIGLEENGKKRKEGSLARHQFLQWSGQI